MRPVLAGAVRLGAGLSVLSTVLVVANLRRLRVPDRAARPARERLAVLVPARDEVGRVGACVEHLRAAMAPWPGPARLLVLDDGSTDGTGDLLRDLAERVPGLEVLAGRPTPPGWLGKPWACHQLAEEALAGGCDVLVLVDADVRVAPSGLVATVALLRHAALDVVCPYPRQVAGSVAERLVQPLLQWSWLSTLPLGLAETSPRPSLTAANGQLLAVDAASYRRAGGFAAVRDQVLDDLALVRAVKAVGGRGGVADGTTVATCRMYDGWPALREGWTKSLWSAFGPPPAAAAVGALLATVHVLPAVAALGGSRAGLVGYAASVLGRVLAARRTGGRVLPDALAHPASVVALLGLVVDSHVGRRTGRLRWKGKAVA